MRRRVPAGARAAVIGRISRLGRSEAPRRKAKRSAAIESRERQLPRLAAPRWSPIGACKERSRSSHSGGQHLVATPQGGRDGPTVRKPAAPIRILSDRHAVLREFVEAGAREHREGRLGDPLGQDRRALEVGRIAQQAVTRRSHGPRVARAPLRHEARPASGVQREGEVSLRIHGASVESARRRRARPVRPKPQLHHRLSDASYFLRTSLSLARSQSATSGVDQRRHRRTRRRSLRLTLDAAIVPLVTSRTVVPPVSSSSGGKASPRWAFTSSVTSSSTSATS